MNNITVVETVLKRDRLLVTAVLVILVLFSWIYILMGAGLGMNAHEMSAMSMMQPAVWTSQYAILMFFMWWIMMIAMMLPSAAPMVLLYALVMRKRRAQDNLLLATGHFTAGYLVIWGGFSALATAMQWGLERTGLLSPMLAGTSLIFGGILLLAAGLYQLTPLKYACLKHCRGPVQFITQHWHDGNTGALRMGLEHGTYCLGCCWLLMALLFVGGVMNLVWIVGLAVIVLLEKVIPMGHRLRHLSGVVLILAGGWMLLRGL